MSNYVKIPGEVLFLKVLKINLKVVCSCYLSSINRPQSSPENTQNRFLARLLYYSEFPLPASV